MNLPQAMTLDPRQGEIHRRLRLIGPGPAIYFQTAAGLIAAEPPLDAATHLAAHCIRECESGVRAVLLPMISEARRAEIERMQEGKHAEWIHECAAVLGIDDRLRAAWQATFVRRAHRWASRDALVAPRPLDDEFRRWWEDVQDVLADLAAAFRAVYLESRDLIDELAAKEQPTGKTQNASRPRPPRSWPADRARLQRREPRCRGR